MKISFLSTLPSWQWIKGIMYYLASKGQGVFWRYPSLLLSGVPSPSVRRWLPRTQTIEDKELLFIDHPYWWKGKRYVFRQHSPPSSLFPSSPHSRWSSERQLLDVYEDEEGEHSCLEELRPYLGPHMDFHRQRFRPVDFSKASLSFVWKTPYGLKTDTFYALDEITMES